MLLHNVENADIDNWKTLRHLFNPKIELVWGVMG